MRRKDKLPELLAPAGDFECLVAAVKGGADAVYVGGKSFGARAFAKNFEIDELARAVVYCHIHGVRLYVTLNTLLTDGELEGAVEFATELYRIGVDALIVCDLGLVRLLRLRLPDMELHASTQMSVHNSLGADEAYRMGCTRVVLAREVSGADIKRITDKCLPEIEVFLHGALCVCHSGQCLFSSLVGGRSGNRGECAQPCRLPYGKGYPLSLCDLSLASHIPELIESGVASLKIEGRMKSPDYVYTVTSIYRRLLDGHRAATDSENIALARAFSRGGFTDGYFTGKISSRSMLGVRSEEDKQATRESETREYTPTRVRILAKCTIKRGEPSRLELTLPSGRRTTERSAFATGAVPEEARSAPLDAEGVKARLCKMGNTPFSLDAEDITLELDDGINLAPSAINALRRDAVSALEGVDKRSLPLPPASEPSVPDAQIVEGVRVTAMFHDPDVYSALTEADLEGVDVAFLPLFRLTECPSTPEGVAIPPVVMEGELDEVMKLLSDAHSVGVKYALVSNIGHISLAKSAGLVAFGDFRLNITNRYTGGVLSELGVNNCILSPELTAPAARQLGGSVITLGRIPLMLTERCFMRDSFGCDACSRCSLTDRKGAAFPMMREYRHRTVIFNSAITYMGDKEQELRGRLYGRHFIFSVESVKETRALLGAYRKGQKMPLSVPLRRLGRREV